MPDTFHVLSYLNISKKKKNPNHFDIIISN